MRWEDLQSDAVNGKGELLSNQQVDCAACATHFTGKLWYPGPHGAEARYCSKCANLKIWDPAGDAGAGPSECVCGGIFESQTVRCPKCRSELKIDLTDKEQIHQLLYCCFRKTDGIPDWVLRTHLYVQLAGLFGYDLQSREWRYYRLFEI